LERKRIGWWVSVRIPEPRERRFSAFFRVTESSSTGAEKALRPRDERGRRLGTIKTNSGSSVLER